MRSQLVTYLSTALTNAAIKCASELPWTDGPTPLYMKNMKKLYIDRDEQLERVLYPVLSPGNDISEIENIVRAYFSVDAKNQPNGLDSAISLIVGAKDVNTITSVVGRLCDYEVSYEGDVLIYTFTYRFISIQ